MLRIGLVNDLHWMHAPPASPTAWHNPGEFEGVLDRLQIALEHFAAREVDLVIAAGDFAHHGDVDSLASVLSALAGASAPALAVSGNHDVVESPRLLERALQQAAVHGVTLATSKGSPHGEIHIAGVHVDASEGWFGVRLRELPDTATWGSEPVLLISHYPVLSLAGQVTASGFPYPGDLIDRGDIADLLSARSAPTVVLSGHIHARASVAEGPLLQITNAAIVEPPYECSVIEIERQASGDLAITRESVRVGPSTSRREPVFSAPHEAWAFDGTHWSAVQRVPATRTRTELPRC
jgi:DNA repair exonuclease SbcCD nuclease subunit